MAYLEDHAQKVLAEKGYVKIINEHVINDYQGRAVFLAKSDSGLYAVLAYDWGTCEYCCRFDSATDEKIEEYLQDDINEIGSDFELADKEFKRACSW